MTDSASAAPTAERDRLPVMDILRGVALLGIFLMNIEFFNRSFQSFTGGLPLLEGIDAAAGGFVYVFVQGKFWVLFSLLFGMGFALMRQRAEAAGRPFAGVYLRRTVLLALFGVAHIVFVWVGDILLTYAIAAIGLMVFMKVRGHALWLCGAALYFGMATLAVLGGLLLGLLPPSAMAPVEAQQAVLVASGEAAATIYREGGFAAITAQRIDDYLGFILTNAVPYQLPMVLGAFLIGAWLVRSGKLADSDAHRRFFVRIAVGGTVLGVLFAAASLAVGTRFDPVTEVAGASLAMGLMMLGNLPASLAYLSIVVLLCLLPGPTRTLSVLAPAGRMALTNYLMQSVIGAFIFYGYGLGLFGQVGRAEQVGIVLAVFVAQVAFSHWWLARYRFGPMEWLWRAGTYLRWPPIRRTAGA